MYRSILIMIFLWAPLPAEAESSTEDTPPVGVEDQAEALADELEATVAVGEESEEEISIDADGSLEVAKRKDGRRGWLIQADVRGLGDVGWRENRDGTSAKDSEVSIRARIGASRGITDSLRAGLRIAASCTSESCSPESILDDNTSGSTDQALDVDEAFLHWFRGDRFDLAVGRLQTKFITKGGVFAKSLDRNDSNNTRITWTDGAHGTLHHRGGWESHVIVQHNPEDGPAQILRDPLNFSSSDSRTSAFVSLVNEQPVRFLTQRAIDVSYFPSALKKDGLYEERRVEDYWGIVARFAGRYPKRSSGRRIRFSAELGYAPETPTRAAVDLAGSGDTKGYAAAFTVSFMDMFRNHSLGFNFAHAEAGWLISPQYNKNERLLELRYVWVAGRNITVDARIRHRSELEPLTTSVQRWEELDAFVRLTWRFRTDLPTLMH